MVGIPRSLPYGPAVNIPKSPSVNSPRQCRRRTQERFQQGKGAAGLVNPSEEPHETRGTYGRSAALSNSAPCRPPCHAPGCTLGIWYGSGDWTAWPRLPGYLSRSW